MSKLRNKLLRSALYVDTVTGICPQCKEDAFLVMIVDNFYKCTNCGEDTKQYINGHIKYLKINQQDKDYIREHGTKG
jgi:uncharacterized protein (DUF983 family)